VPVDRFALDHLRSERGLPPQAAEVVRENDSIKQAQRNQAWKIDGSIIADKPAEINNAWNKMGSFYFMAGWRQ